MQCSVNIKYQNLLKNLKRINATMRDYDMANLPDLLDEHDSILKDIKESDLTKEPELRDLIQKSINQLQSIISETEKLKDGIAGQLKTIGNKQKLDSVYSQKQ